ncbi:hypothetical protein MTO96_011931 [Rhipicephalus appendiculatus]
METRWPRGSAFVHSLLLLLLVATHSGRTQLAELPALGCSYDHGQQALLCSNTTLDKVLTSLRIFGTFLNQTLQPRSLAIWDSQLPQLPFFLGQFNRSLHTLRLVRCHTQHIFPDAFAGLEQRLTTLDLSENSLYSVPYALGTLRSLEVLNLSRNSIAVLRPGPVFSRMRALRILDLSGNLLGVDPQFVTGARVAEGDHAELSMKLAENLTAQDFDVAPLAGSLERLLLGANRLATVPEQLHRQLFARLRELDLSDNALATLPNFGAALTPNLTDFSARNNQLEAVPFYSIPPAETNVDLTGNPMRCDCGALWLRELQSEPAPRVRLPPCASPEGYRGRSLSSITPEALCWHGNLTRLYGYRLRGFSEHSLLALTSLETSLTVTWSVANKGLRWTLLYRKENSSPYMMTVHPRGREGTHTTGDEAVFTDIISGLQSDTAYVVCVGIQQQQPLVPYLMDPKKCHIGRTRRHAQPATQLTTSVVTVNLQVTSPLPHHKKARTVLLAMRSSIRSVTVRWKVSAVQGPSKRSVLAKVTEDQVLPREWVVLVRKFGSHNFTEIQISDSNGDGRYNSTYSYTVADLDPSTAYDICLIAMDSVLEDNMEQVPGYTKPVPSHLLSAAKQDDGQLTMTCKETTTKSANEPVPIKTIAVVTTVSTTTTAFVVALICCCFPRKTFGNCFRKVKNKLKPADSVNRGTPEKDNSYHSSDNSVKLLVPVHNSAYEDTEPMKSANLHYSPWEDLTITRKPPRRVKSEHFVNSVPYLQPKKTTTTPEANYMSLTKSHSTNEDGAYMTPAAAFALGQGYLNSNCIQYLDGKKVQVYSCGSKTLPKSCLRSSSRKRRAKANNFFQSRYSPSVKKKEREKTPPPIPRSSTTPRRDTIGRSSQRLSFRTFGKSSRDEGETKTSQTLPRTKTDSSTLFGPAPGATVRSSSSRPGTASDCEVFIEHV